MNCKITVTWLLSFYVLFEFVFAQERKEETFYVKPGAGALSVEHEVNGYNCKFSYAAQGGTHEEWTHSLEIIDGGSAVMCTIERAVSSYLFFEHFKMELTGPQVSISDVDIKSSPRDSLKPVEYTQGRNEVSSSAQFKNQLGKVAVYASLPRDDL